MEFHERLKELRQERNLTHEGLAKEIGFSKSIIGYWENGKKQPTLSALLALARFFEVTLDFLAGIENEDGTKVRF